MQTPMFSRRGFVQSAVATTSGLLAATALPSGAAETEKAGGAAKKLKIICVGAHPDDPESGCAGTLIRYAAEGHVVRVVYLTRGERGIRGKNLDEAAKIRTAESEAACKIMGAQPIFFGQIDGATEVNKTHADAMTKLLADEKADVVFAHWPIDAHMDHQVASLLTVRACIALNYRPHLYFFEVDTGGETSGFSPETYVDVSTVLDQKRSALLEHTSQNAEGIWREYHEPIARWRGRESGVKAAEAFVHLNRDVTLARLPGV